MRLKLIKVIKVKFRARGNTVYNCRLLLRPDTFSFKIDATINKLIFLDHNF